MVSPKTQKYKTVMRIIIKELLDAKIILINTKFVQVYNM